MSVSAKVQVTLEFTNLGGWAPGCTVEQINSQAIRAANNRVINLIKASGDTNVRVIGGISVCEVTTKFEKPVA